MHLGLASVVAGREPPSSEVLTDTATTRSRSACAARRRHPTQVRIGDFGRARRAIEESTLPPAGQVGPSAAGFTARFGRTGSAQVRNRIRTQAERYTGPNSPGVGDDVDPPAGQSGRQPSILALTADGQRQLVVRNHDLGCLSLKIDNRHRAHPRRGQGVANELGRDLRTSRRCRSSRRAGRTSPREPERPSDRCRTLWR